MFFPSISSLLFVSLAPNPCQSTHTRTLASQMLYFCRITVFLVTYSLFFACSLRIGINGFKCGFTSGSPMSGVTDVMASILAISIRSTS
ncbi:hypothetical protein K474DRAFT_90601 [Panus rudis PR-1116 ss-1]|nr:hypothetical protein K474DRAFT_90601 [Panus rudis PR-1116 ss-1]